jgi:hypothetical protein
MDVHTLRVHQASTMLWSKGSKPSFARLNNKVWVPFKVLPVVAVSFLLPCQFPRRLVPLLMMCN